jgi:hypothetical protein
MALAQSDGSAFAALKLLPKEAAKRLCRIEARDGSPVPERWHFLVYDPVAERGVREFVVANGKMVAVRTLSQFADTLNETEAFGGETLKVDSETIARWAALFAVANGGKVGSLNYQMAKDPVSNGPVWVATVLDPVGDQLGALTVDAVKGAILNSDGFETAPAPELLASPVAAPVSSRSSRARIATPAPTPKPNVLRRIFGASEEKSAKPAR